MMCLVLRAGAAPLCLEGLIKLSRLIEWSFLIAKRNGGMMTEPSTGSMQRSFFLDESISVKVSYPLTSKFLFLEHVTFDGP